MLSVLLPTICPACGVINFGDARCECPPETVIETFGEHDPLLAEILERALPRALGARNLRNVIRAEGIEQVKVQMGALVEALTQDLLGFCERSLTHRMVDREYVRRAVRYHITQMAAMSGEADDA